MTQNEINALASTAQQRAREVLDESGIAGIWQRAGCRVNLVGSMRMGLLAAHRDIDLHIYSRGITEESSFAIAAHIAAQPGVVELKCINGLHTDEHCMAWHAIYSGSEGERWQFDMIHIEEGTEYDGFFERMADRIAAVMTEDQRNAILRLKFEASDSHDFHGVEYYEAVIAHGITTVDGLSKWVADHRKQKPYYWIP